MFQLITDCSRITITITGWSCVNWQNNIPYHSFKIWIDSVAFLAYIVEIDSSCTVNWLSDEHVAVVWEDAVNSRSDASKNIAVGINGPSKVWLIASLKHRESLPVRAICGVHLVRDICKSLLGIIPVIGAGWVDEVDEWWYLGSSSTGARLVSKSKIWCLEWVGFSLLEDKGGDQHNQEVD